MKSVIEYSLKELRDLPITPLSEIVNQPYDQIIIVPTENIHDSGYLCMKYVLVKIGEEYPPKIVGVVGGWSDVLHLCWEARTPKANIDCLPNSECLRLILYENCLVPYFVGSDFYVISETEAKENETN